MVEGVFAAGRAGYACGHQEAHPRSSGLPALYPGGRHIKKENLSNKYNKSKTKKDKLISNYIFRIKYNNNQKGKPNRTN